MTLPNITKKQQEIIKYLYHFRFLNRIQIQALLKHKDYKTIYLWLKDLTEKEYLNRNYCEKYIERTKPAVYYIGPNGIKLFKTLIDCSKEQLKKLHREKDREDSCITKCQLIGDVFINFRNKSDENVSYKVTTSSGFSSPESAYRFLTETTFDLVIEKAEGNKRKYYLVELFESNMPSYSIRKRIKNYFDFYFSNCWEDNTGEDFPIVILICSTSELLIKARKISKTLLLEHDIDLQIKLTTDNEIVKTVL